jgi:hypothetical protein
MSEPRVSSGLRGSKDRGDLSDQGGPQIPYEDIRPADTGEAVFVAGSVMYRMTLWVDWDKVTYSTTGRRQPDRRDVQFTGNTYRTKDAREIEAIRKSSVYGVTVFDLADLAKRAAESRLDTALAAADDPAIADALRVKLGVKEVTMPTRAKTGL